MIGTYDCLYDIGKIVRHCNQKSSFLGIGAANFVDPAQDQRSSAHLPWMLASSHRSFVHITLLTPMLANQYTIMRPVMSVYSGILRSTM